MTDQKIDTAELVRLRADSVAPHSCAACSRCSAVRNALPVLLDAVDVLADAEKSATEVARQLLAARDTAVVHADAAERERNEARRQRDESVARENVLHEAAVRVLEFPIGQGAGADYERARGALRAAVAVPAPASEALARAEAAERERDEALAKLGRVTAQRDRLREVMETVGEEWVSHSQACTDAAKAWGERNGTDADYPPCTCGLDAALTEEP